VMLHDYALYKSTFTLLYFTSRDGNISIVDAPFSIAYSKLLELTVGSNADSV